MGNHCEDCCCARSWEALGIDTYTGRSIPEEIERVTARNKILEDALQPFANAHGNFNDPAAHITLHDLRRAFDAIAAADKDI